MAITHESQEQNIELYNRFRSLGLESYQVKMAGRFDPRAITRLYRLIKQESIDIIHTHGYKSDIIGLIVSAMTGIKHVATPHGFENDPELKLRFYAYLACLTYRHIEWVAPLSEELVSDMHGIKVSPDKIRLIMNGVDLEEIESERNKHTPFVFPDPNEKKIGYVGQMIYRKNVGDLIKIFDLLYQEYKNIRLILIGDGPIRGKLEQEARSMASSTRIEFMGYREDRLRIVKELDLFCMTSSLEGIPRCMMEAMAMKVPVVAYDIPGVDKLIIHEKTGLMADFGQLGEMKQHWKRLLFDKEFSSRIARNGREHVVEKFSARRMAEEYTEFYEEILSF